MILPKIGRILKIVKIQVYANIGKQDISDLPLISQKNHNDKIFMKTHLEDKLDCWYKVEY